MTIRINLLPHREEKRVRRRNQYTAMAVICLLAAVAVAGAIWYVMETRVEQQQARNKFITDEIAKLDKQIEEIKKIREETADLLQKKQVVEGLQSNRSEPVYLLDQLLRQLPEGVYLKSFKQTGLKVNVVGLAQSQPRVSTLMRNVSASPYLERPELVEVKSVAIPNSTVVANEFSLNVYIKRARADDGKAKKSTPAEKKA
jgi:type IV pilus assembly protein PilN